MASGSDDHSIKLWNLGSGQVHRYLAIWDPITGVAHARFGTQHGRIESLTFCGDQLLATGASNNEIRVWQASTGENLLRLVGHTGTVAALTYHAPSGLLVSGSFDTSICLWTLPNDGKLDHSRGGKLLMQ